MDIMKKLQIIGIGITLVGVVSYLLVVDNNITPAISGALTAIGLGLIFKLISFKKRTSTE